MRGPEASLTRLRRSIRAASDQPEGHDRSHRRSKRSRHGARGSPPLRRLGGRPPRHHGDSLRGRALSQSRFLRIDRRALFRSARRLALRRARDRHDLRHRQQGAGPFGRLDLRSDGNDLRHDFRADLFRHGHLDGRLLVPGHGSDDRADQRLHGHGPRSAGLHRDADDAVHRSRRDPRPHRRQEHRLRNQGWGLSRLLPSGRDQRARLQQPDHSLRHHRRHRRRRACLHHDRLDDLLGRRQRAGGALRRHQHALRAHALLCALFALRGDRGAHERRAEQGRRSARRLRPGAHRHFVGHRRRSGDFRRPGTDPRLLPRRDPHRAHRQGSARRHSHHPHDRSRRRRDRAGGGGDAIAARRGSRLPRGDPHHRRADRALARPAPRHSPPLGLVARAAAAAGSRSRRRRDLWASRPAARPCRRGVWANAGSPPSSIAGTRRR